MSFAEVRETLLRDFVLSVERQQVPPLSGYLPDYVKPGGAIELDDYRLVPLTATALRFLLPSSLCLTDGMLELQSKYAQFVPDDWGGHFEKGSRGLGVIGFNIRDGIVLEIVEINPATSYAAWAASKLESLEWERLLIRAVTEVGRCWQAQQIRVQPAHRHPVSAELAADPARAAAFQEELKRTYDASAQACGFRWDQALDCFVLDLGTSV